MKKYSLIIIIILLLCPDKILALNHGIIKGIFQLDSSWSTTVYLSYIPSFDKIRFVGSQMIVAESEMDEKGNFSFNIDFLPKETNLFRIHIVKKGDTPNTLIIGGKDENYLLLLANSHSDIEINNSLSSSPFDKVCFKGSYENKTFQKVINLISYSENIAEQSNTSKREFIESQLEEQLREIADTCSNPLISLYALFNSNFEKHSQENLNYYIDYLKKWNNQNNRYFEDFKKKLTIEENKSQKMYVLFVLLLLSIGFVVLGKVKKQKSGINKLSVQERKVFELLKKGASNQEISEEYSISLSTAKSHVSSILKKLNLKSRKEIMNMNKNAIEQ